FKEAPVFGLGLPQSFLTSPVGADILNSNDYTPGLEPVHLDLDEASGAGRKDGSGCSFGRGDFQPSRQAHNIGQGETALNPTRWQAQQFDRPLIAQPDDAIPVSRQDAVMERIEGRLGGLPV